MRVEVFSFWLITFHQSFSFIIHLINLFTHINSTLLVKAYNSCTYSSLYSKSKLCYSVSWRWISVYSEWLLNINYSIIFISTSFLIYDKSYFDSWKFFINWAWVNFFLSFFFFLGSSNFYLDFPKTPTWVWKKLFVVITESSWSVKMSPPIELDSESLLLKQLI